MQRVLWLGGHCDLYHVTGQCCLGAPSLTAVSPVATNFPPVVPLFPGPSVGALGETVIQVKNLPHGSRTSKLSPLITTQVLLAASNIFMQGFWELLVCHAPY